MPRKVFLQPKPLVRHSRLHTAYAGDATGTPDGKPAPLYKLEFHNGVAHDVPEQLYQRFKDLGIADVKRPSFDDEA